MKIDQFVTNVEQIVSKETDVSKIEQQNGVLRKLTEELEKHLPKGA